MGIDRLAESVVIRATLTKCNFWTAGRAPSLSLPPCTGSGVQSSGFGSFAKKATRRGILPRRALEPANPFASSLLRELAGPPARQTNFTQSRDHWSRGGVVRQNHFRIFSPDTSRAIATFSRRHWRRLYDLLLLKFFLAAAPCSRNFVPVRLRFIPNLPKG